MICSSAAPPNSNTAVVVSTTLVWKVICEIAPAASHIQNDHEADAAHDDKRVGDDIQQHIAAVGYQVCAAAQRVKTRIVKGSDRVEILSHTACSGIWLPANAGKPSTAPAPSQSGS